MGIKYADIIDEMTLEERLTCAPARICGVPTILTD